MKKIQNILRPLIQAIVRWSYAGIAPREIWEKSEFEVPLKLIHHLRKDIPQDFKTFTQSPLIFVPANIEEVEMFLKKCEYVPDEVQFKKKDFWQDPAEFEQLKKGDCEDHALWAWRVLRDLGYKTEFVIGRIKNKGRHAWVHFYKDGQLFCFESVNKKIDMVLTLDTIQSTYTPFFSIDENFKSWVYGGVRYSLGE